MALNKHKKYIEDDFDLDSFHQDANRHVQTKRTNEKNRKLINGFSILIIVSAFVIAYLLYNVLDYFIVSFL